MLKLNKKLIFNLRNIILTPRNHILVYGHNTWILMATWLFQVNKILTPKKHMI